MSSESASPERSPEQAPAARPRWEFWIDRGGTFTDVVARRPDGGYVTRKLLSENPGRYDDAALQGIREILSDHGEMAAGGRIPTHRIRAVKMGTTVGTNALLERTGEPTVLVTNRGFGDCLRIGYQNRPRLFDLHIRLPEPLYGTVVEIGGRHDRDGAVLEPLDREDARSKLAAAHREGYRAVAIVLMHAYRFHDFERQLADIAREVGFTQISTSHGTSPLMRIVSRGDTTVVDAYLSPILRRYVDRVAAELAGTRLMFMQSNGGLTDAALFQGKDCILSGPAGGVVGAVRTTERAGFSRVIGFDMGGTSTDVSHYAGELERVFETEVAGVRLRSPMMHIHTVAAGGGSILHFDGSRFTVGPDSAGADPGPACYRRGGPLAVTDCNVMLGRLQPAFFPRVFGPEANEPLDAELVRQRFRSLAREVEASTGERMEPERIAHGFLTIAVENMAHAIKKISIQRGYDVSEYVLACFGGAGGQHACLVADALGMETVFIHPFAGVLSAYGMGLADVRALREQAVEEPLEGSTHARVEALLEALAGSARDELLEQGVEPGRISVERRLHIRYQGTDTALEVPFGTLEALRAAFEQAHRGRFGFIDQDRPLIVEAAVAEAIGHGEPVDDPVLRGPRTAGDPPLEPLARVDAWFTSEEAEPSPGEGEGGAWSSIPLYDRAHLLPDDRVRGPAIIREETATTVVEPGWEARMDEQGHLLLVRIVPRRERAAVGTDVDPVRLEIFNNLFMSIAEQMGVVLENTAHSVNIKERLDFSCAVFDRRGDLVANAPHMPVHLGSMSESIKAVIDAHGGTMQPGDVYVLNAPYNGGTHLPDVTVITPVFDLEGDGGDPEVLFYVASRGHHADIGGISPGSMPPFSRTVEEEGVLLDNLKLVDRGRFLEDEIRARLTAGPWPSRNPENNIADLKAQVAACTKGVQELRRIVAHFGLDTVHAYMQHVQDNAEESVRRVLDRLGSGSFTYALDNGARIAVSVGVDRQERRARIDFTGTSAQLPDNYNAPTAVCRAAVLYVFRTLVRQDIPLNAGCLKPLELVIPEGSMLNPRYPAAVVAGNVETSQNITDTLYGALGVLAASGGTMNNFTFGNERWQYYETICSGAGAGPDFDGASAVHVHMTNSRLTDPEVLEWRFPVLLERFEIRRGSGGRGRHRGGDGVVRRVRFLEPMSAAILSSHRVVPPFGLAGGEPGATGRNYVERADGRIDELAGADTTEMGRGDVFVIETPGGGGYGAPPPEE